MRLMIVLALAILAAGCSEEGPAQICERGELQACPCIGGAEGVQACADDSQGWDECQCEPGNGSGGAAGSGGVAGSGGSAGSGGAAGANYAGQTITFI